MQTGSPSARDGDATVGSTIRNHDLAWTRMRQERSGDAPLVARTEMRMPMTGMEFDLDSHRLEGDDPFPHARQERQASSVRQLWRLAETKKPGPSLL